MKIIHIADVHWRGLTRHEEYISAFTDLFEQARDLNPDGFVVAGDIVHSKTQGISPELIDCLNWWFTEMSSIAPVHVMLGNHDGLVLNTDRQDAISPILRALNIPNIYLYRNSGIYPDPNWNEFYWHVFSPFDVSSWKDLKPVPGKINIALYHGPVWGSHTDSEWMLESENKMKMFENFDFTMLGDIHKRQQLDKEGRIWYCGSTIQQNYGESGEKGFLLWDIKDKNTWDVKFYPVKHKNPFVTVDFLKNIQSTVQECEKHPNGARFRIRSYKQLDPKTQRKLATVLRRVKSADEVVFKIDPKSNSDLGIAEATVQKVKIENLSRVETHKKLIREYYGEETETQKFWEAADKILTEIVPNTSKLQVSSKTWSLHKMNFDNTFGYGEDNCIDFRKLNGVVGLFGRNRAGKSSIPGTIMYGLYNTNDRGISSLLHVVNTRKPHASADITFTVDGKLYRLERQTVRHKVKNRAETTITHLNLYEVDSDDKIIRDLSGEQRRETEETLRNLIGNPEEFMMTSFAPQGNMNSFIQRGSTERKRILSNFLGLEIFDLLHARVKEEGAGIKSMLKRLQVKDWVTEIRSSKQKIKTLEEQTNVLKRSLTSEKEKYSELKSIAQKEHNDDFIDPDLIKSLERKIKTKMATLENTQTEILSYEEKIISLNTRLEKYELIKNQFPIESLKRRQNTLDSLKLNLSKIDSKLKAEKSILKSQQKSVKLLNEVPCGDKFPSCKFIKESHKNKILVEKQNQIVADLTENVLSLKANVLDLEKEGLHNKIERYTAMLKKEAEDKLKTVKFESTIAEKTRDMSLLEKETEKLQKNLLELKLRNKTEFNDELTQLEKKLSKISKIISEIEDKIVRTAEKIGHSRSNISQLQKDQIEYDKLQVEWKVYDFLIKATSWRGIPTYIMRKQIPVINKELSSILQDATGFTIEFEINERNMNVFLNYGDSRRPIECASGMEKMISSLAIRVALSNISNLNKPDMLIVDEGFGTLDPQNIEVVTSLLHRLKSFYKQIIIISHVEVIKDSVDDMIEITKRGVDSRVRYE